MRQDTGVTTNPSVNHYQSKTALSWSLPTAALCLDVFLIHSFPFKHLCFVVGLCLYIVSKAVVIFLEETLESFKIVLNFYCHFHPKAGFCLLGDILSKRESGRKGKLMES